jgi:peptidoglycan L-alanyl-D-glutamate endopeptidase CwlK
VNFVAAIVTAVLDWIARLSARPPSRPAAETPADPGLPPAQNAPLHNRFGGRAWRYDADGVHADGELLRTSGEPVTCRAILALYRDIILAAAKKHGIDPALIVMTIATETGSLRADRFTGPRTFRWEAHVPNRDVAPSFKGSYSAGPMQVLATTARDLITKRGAEYDLGYRSLAIAPVLRARPDRAPATHPMYDPAISIDLGAAVIRRGLALTGNDPILVAAAYNAGGLYESRANPWHLRSHADHLTRAARWYGDACAVLRE